MSGYPFGIDKPRYNKIVGALRVKNIVEIITQLGFPAEYAEVENEDVDIWVYNAENNLVIVIEVTNWRPSSYMSEKKGKSVQSNFREYKCNKLFICSFRDITRNREEYFDNDVDIIELLFQTQPPPWYEWWLDQERADGMKAAGDETMEVVLATLLQYFLEKGLISPSFFE